MVVCCLKYQGYKVSASNTLLVTRINILWRSLYLGPVFALLIETSRFYDDLQRSIIHLSRGFSGQTLMAFSVVVMLKEVSQATL